MTSWDRPKMATTRRMGQIWPQQPQQANAHGQEGPHAQPEELIPQGGE